MQKVSHHVLLSLLGLMMCRAVVPAPTHLLHEPQREKVFHKLPQVLLRYSVMEKCHFSINDPKYRWRAVSSEVIRQPSLVADIYHPDSNT